jgi:hypothetical protein
MLREYLSLHLRCQPVLSMSPLPPPPQEKHGSKMAFLDGAPPERLCQPMVDYITGARLAGRTGPCASLACHGTARRVAAATAAA